MIINIQHPKPLFVKAKNIKVNRMLPTCRLKTTRRITAKGNLYPQRLRAKVYQLLGVNNCTMEYTYSTELMTREETISYTLCGLYKKR